AVLGILKKAGAPKSLEIKITGESLFNDGIGVVVFLAILGVVKGEAEFSAGHLTELFFVEAVGGILLGLALGGLSFWMLKQIDDHKLEVLITLALVTGGYALAAKLHTSGPLAMVVAGLMIGNHGRTLAMSASTVDHLDSFWELLDEILNALLFLLIGFEVLVLSFQLNYLTAGLIAIPLVLACRFTAVALPINILKPFRTFSPGVTKILTWGGLRGGISVALALAIPASAGRDLFLVMTYTVVIFSIAVQGMTLKNLFKPNSPQ
ncbi:MAG: cation:proton antiporter, partial [Verrucomicrobiales bacterium]|nr:cation:proton antiporter [Verrucomicrobiales bacterium]